MSVAGSRLRMRIRAYTCFCLSRRSHGLVSPYCSWNAAQGSRNQINLQYACNYRSGTRGQRQGTIIWRTAAAESRCSRACGMSMICVARKFGSMPPLDSVNETRLPFPGNMTQKLPMERYYPGAQEPPADLLKR